MCGTTPHKKIMKKKKIRTLIIALLVIILAIIILVKVIGKKDGNQESKLVNIYNELSTSSTYICTIEQNDNNKTIMAKKDSKTAIDQYSGESHTTTIVDSENTYLVLHDRQEYYIYKGNNVEQSILTDGIKDLLNKKYTVGNEKIRGKNYTYEEYEGSTVFMISNTPQLNEEGVKTRIYFSKDSKIVYVKTIFGDQDELLKVKLSNDVDNALFEIPANYAEN